MSHEPIPIKVMYTDTDGKYVETTFSSLYKASKSLSINIPTLKELYHGEHPKLRDGVPKDIIVVRLDAIPKEHNNWLKKEPNDKWHCQICDKDIKYKSKYEHVLSTTHKKRELLLT